MADSESPEVNDARRFWEFWILVSFWIIVAMCVLAFWITIALDHKELPSYKTLLAQFWPWLGFLGILVIFTIWSLLEKITGKKLDDERDTRAKRIFFLVLVVSLIVGVTIFFLIIQPDLSEIGFWPFMVIPFLPFLIMLYPAMQQALHPLTDDEVEDLREHELNMYMPYDKAFGLCETALEMMDIADYIEAKVIDRNSGTLSLQASPVFHLPERPTRITISLEEKNPTVTRVKISCVTPFLTSRRALLNPTGLNEHYLNQITEYLAARSGNTKRIAMSGT